MLLKKSLLICFVLLSLLGVASHNRAGEITYKRVPPYTTVVAGITVPTYSYVITIIHYTDDATTASPNSLVADRCVDTVYFGDGEKALVDRMNGGTPLCTGCNPCGCDHCGEIIIDENGFRVKKNIYQVTHVYPAPGNYRIRSRDPFRNADVANIPHSDQVAFYIETLLIIFPFDEPNTSPVLLNAPIDRACINKCFTHNPAAYDADGDKLTYEIIKCLQDVGDTIPGYTFPNAGTGDPFSIDPNTGTLTWCSPRKRGQYNVAFVVHEWRRDADGSYRQIGYVIRDMQINVEVCPNNDPPVVATPADTCVEAGALVSKRIRISDINTGNRVTVTGNSGGFSATAPAATLTHTSGLMSTSNNNSFYADFSWQTTCNHVRLQPYECVFKAQDDGTPIPLAGFGTYNIRIVPPAVKNVKALPTGSSIKVSWDLSGCSPSDNPLKQYWVYRKNNCDPFTQAPCQTGVPPAWGFALIAKVDAPGDLFLDDNNGNGLTVGQNYNYLVVAVYEDGSESFASAAVCSRLKRNIPLLLNADVRSTSADNGSIYLHWENPLTTPDNLDTLAFPGPYSLTISYRKRSDNSYTPLYTFASPYFRALANEYLHTGINTLGQGYEYSIDFKAGATLIGSSQRATSVFLSATSGDRKVSLQWASQTPWQNYSYSVWRKGPQEQSFSEIGTTTLNSYTDSTASANPIANRHVYCYKVQSKGAYSDPSIVKPLLNFSQEICIAPEDKTPPCTPVLNVEADCALGTATVSWNDVKQLSCGDDVISYNLYYKPTINGEYRQVATGLFYLYKYDGSDKDSLISGCYAIQASDSSGNVSALSPDFCLDNCPVFELPNIFTPNRDGINEFFKAIRVRQIREINMQVFDRWGNLVYKTSDPYFNWNGVSIRTGQPVSAGTFFYICDVFENRLKGQIRRTLKGYVQVMY